MKHELFSRNWLFINETLQDKISKTNILLCGTGMGSQILITLIRLGFRHFTIADGDTVSLSNLNRQHFFNQDIDKNKAHSIAKYAKEINPEVQLNILDKFLNEEDLKKEIPNCDFIVNCIDLDSPAFLQCHTLCKEFKKVELFPVNLGMGTGILLSDASTPSFEDFFNLTNSVELKEKLLMHMINHDKSSTFLKEKLVEYKEKIQSVGYDPQNVVSTLFTSGLISVLIMKILEGSSVDLFPKVNYLEVQ